METSLERAWQLYRFRRYPMALEAAMRYLAQHPEDSEAQCLISLIHGKEGREAEALCAVEEAIKHSPDWSYAHYVQATVASWFREYQLAFKALNEALRLQPTNANYYHLLAELHYERGHPHTSIMMAERGLEQDAENVGCLYRRGVAMYDLKEHTNAEGTFRNILRIMPEHAPSQGFLGQYAVERGDCAAALPLLRNALADSPGWIMAQTAWRECLRSRYPVYGVVARIKQWIYDKHLLRVFLLLFAMSYPFLFAFADTEGRGLAAQVVVVALYSACMGGFVLLALYFLFTGYLNLVSRILLFADQELRRSFSWKETVKEHKGILFIFVGIILGLIIMIFKSKP